MPFKPRHRHNLGALLGQEQVAKLRLGIPRHRGVSRGGGGVRAVVVVVRRTVELHRDVVLSQVDVHREIPVIHHEKPKRRRRLRVLYNTNEARRAPLPWRALLRG